MPIERPAYRLVPRNVAVIMRTIFTAHDRDDRRRRIGIRAFVTIAVAICVVAAAPLGAQKQLEMRLPGYVFVSSAEVRLMVFVEPHPDNRSLVVEVDGDNMFTSSQIPLDGGSEKRLHHVRFRSLQPGEYVIRAILRSGAGVRATIASRVLVAEL
jgi:hypothetical protein